MSLSYKRRALRGAVETAYGTYESPTLDIQTRAGTLSVDALAGDVVERDVDRGHLDTLGSLRAGEHAKIEFEVELAQPVTPGSAPPWGTLLLGCAAAETELTAVTGTLAASSVVGGMSGNVTLDGGASASDNAYTGRIIDISTGRWLITGYVGSTKVASLDYIGGTVVTPGGSAAYSIRAAHRYTPISSFGADSSLSFDYLEADEASDACTLFQFRGARGEVTISFNEKGVPVAKFSLLALLRSRTDTTLPALDYSDWGEPVVPNSQVWRLHSVHGYEACIARQFEFMTGSASAGGFKLNQERIRIPTRNPTGRLDVEALLLADKDFYSAIASNTTGELLMSHGIGADSRIVFRAPAMQIRGKTPPQNVDGIAHTTLDMAFRAATSAGNDSWSIIC